MEVFVVLALLAAGAYALSQSQQKPTPPAQAASPTQLTPGGWYSIQASVPLSQTVTNPDQAVAAVKAALGTQGFVGYLTVQAGGSGTGFPTMAIGQFVGGQGYLRSTPDVTFTQCDAVKPPPANLTAPPAAQTPFAATAAPAPAAPPHA